jgi:hypothetical protein
MRIIRLTCVINLDRLKDLHILSNYVFNFFSFFLILWAFKKFLKFPQWEIMFRTLGQSFRSIFFPVFKNWFCFWKHIFDFDSSIFFDLDWNIISPKWCCVTMYKVLWLMIYVDTFFRICLIYLKILNFSYVWRVVSDCICMLTRF